jgi:Xaa-Pro aminopeptidase
MTDANPDELGRRAALEAAQDQALSLFAAIESGGLIAPGRNERDIEADIHALAAHRFGVGKHWHKRIVRAGANTVTTAYDDPPLRRIEADDTVYVDLGPVFEDWEADVGRTYVLGANTEKRRLVGDLTAVFARVGAHYRALPDITGAQLYAFARQAADDAGWEFGGTIAGHTVSEFSHAWKDVNRISPKNPAPMRGWDEKGRVKHWILEIHLVDRARTFGGFFEQLL